jgi:hypothetical protein
MKALFSKKMPLTENHLFEKFEKMAKAIKQDFKNKGLVIPSKRKDGSILIGDYIVVKKSGAYYINNRRGHSVVGPLNLPQTAIVVANDLALGRWADQRLLESDKWYGWKAFAEQAATAQADRAYRNKDPDRADLSQYKAITAGEQKLFYKKSIDSRFDKLCKLT